MQKHVLVSKSCRSRQELSNEYFLAKFGVDTEENGPIKFAHLAEKSENGSISNLSTKAIIGPQGLQPTATALLTAPRPFAQRHARSVF